MQALRRILLILLSALIICGGGAYVLQNYIPEMLDARISALNTEFTSQNRVLNERILTLEDENKNLKKQLQSLGQSVLNLENSSVELKNNSQQESPKTELQTQSLKPDFKKWESWCALKKKLKLGRSYESELAEFQKNFADHPEILRMVEELNKNNLENRNKLIDNLLNLLKIRCVDEHDLAKISGYVLLLSGIKE